MGALNGIRVLDLSRLLPGPYCSMVLADHGAEVLALEDRRFLKDNLFFQDLYRNKRHMTLNLKSDKGRAIFYQLLASTDVLIEGFRPGVMQRLGVDYDAVCRKNPRIIYCSISGYGQQGVSSQTAGHDVNYLSRAGILNCIGEAGGPPVIPAVQIADIAGGAMNGVIGILLALYERERSGKGQFIDISMTDGLLGFLALPNVLEKTTGMQQQRSTSMLSHRYGCYNTYETADGRYIALGAVENRFWCNLCSILGLEEYEKLQYDEHRRTEIIDRLRAIFKGKDLEYWQMTLADADVCYSKVQNMEEVFADPLFQERQMVLNQDPQKDKERTFGVSVKLNRTPGTVSSQPPTFGENTRDVLNELGYSEEAILELFDAGVV
jgi:crotonobetainyl-CoA:carnitine CoA-transferase CaiB-like acyl-CoA transferase